MRCGGKAGVISCELISIFKSRESEYFILMVPVGLDAIPENVIIDAIPENVIICMRISTQNT